MNVLIFSLILRAAASADSCAKDQKCDALHDDLQDTTSLLQEKLTVSTLRDAKVGTATDSTADTVITDIENNFKNLMHNWSALQRHSEFHGSDHEKNVAAFNDALSSAENAWREMALKLKEGKCACRAATWPWEGCTAWRAWGCGSWDPLSVSGKAVYTKKGVCKDSACTWAWSYCKDWEWEDCMSW